jgi:predicted alpha/beta hydrolase family esterase
MTTKKVIILHGAYGYPDENWFGWLKSELVLQGVSCEVPAFPTPAGQSLQGWLEVFKETAARLDEKTILIGHSLGAAFLLRWLELNPVQLRASILVGAFLGAVGIPRFDEINQDFFVKAFDWELLRKCSKEFFCYQGSNDPYVSKAMFDFIADQLQARRILVAQGGHLNAAAGYRQFPLLLNHVNQLLEQA